MPQSIEHLHVLDLLGVPKTIPVITKADLATESEIQRVVGVAQNSLNSTSLSSCSPQVVDSISKRGIIALRETIFAACRNLVPKKSQSKGLVYMPIDRSFVVKGVGTVVTGTLTCGRFSRSDTVAISSGNGPCRIRSLHNHFKSVESITAGHRVGV